MADVSNRSGGADLNAEQVDIGGDVVGRDKIIQQATHNYFGAMPAQPHRAELPHQPYFFGREEELAIIAEALDPESNGWGVLIDGLGGIGKTALAIRAGHLASDSVYPTKIFLSAKIRELTPQGEQPLEDFMLPNYMVLLSELARELGDTGIERINPAERAREVRRLLENSHALIILDNLETFDEQERDRLFQFLKRLPHSCKAIVTSRRRTDVAAEIIRLDRLTHAAALSLIDKLAGRYPALQRATEAERQQLYETAGGNPLLLEWLAGQLGRPASRCRTIAQANQYLQQAPPHNDPLEYIFGDLADTFTDSEAAVLAALSHFTLPAKVKWLADIAGIAVPAVQTALEDLTNRALVVSDVLGQSYSLWSLTASFLRRRRPETVMASGNRLSDQIYALVQENGYDNHDRFPMLESEWPCIEAALPLFVQGDYSQLSTVCDALYYFLTFSGRWGDLISLNLRSEERALANNDLYNAGWRAHQAGYVYSLRGQASEVLACAERVARYWEHADAYEQSSILWLRGWGYRLQKRYDAALTAYQAALMLDRTRAPDSIDMVIDLNSVAEIERLSGDYSSAERDYHEALRIANLVNYRDGIAFVIGNLAALALDRQDWLKARELAQQSLVLSESIGRQELIARNCTCLAQALTRLNDPAGGLPYAQQAVEIFAQLRHRDLDGAQAVLKECGG